MLTRMYLYSTSTKLSIDVWLYLDRPGSLRAGVPTSNNEFKQLSVFYGHTK